MKKHLFKQYNQGEISLFPNRLDSHIPPHHLVRVISEVVDRLDLSQLIESYQGGGCSSYHPRMLLKVLLYAYCLKLYTGRKIANALYSDITFMWLSGNQYPNFRTINHFRSGRLKAKIENIFKSLLLFMFESGYIQLEEYYCDGTILQADANKHKVVWKKNSERYRKEIESRIESTLVEIDVLNREEELLYGDNDLPIAGKDDPSLDNRIEEAIKTLNQIANPNKKSTVPTQAKGLQNKLEMDVLREDIYKKQELTCGERCGYSKTDPQATPMRTKECPEDLRPGYNVLIGSDGQFIVGISVHQNPNDGTCFKNHMQEALPLLPKKAGIVVADAIFGTEENYEYLAGEEIPDLLKYPAYDKEQKKQFKENAFNKENMPYDSINDCFLCPYNRLLTYRGDEIIYNRNGFPSTLRKYECQNCSKCPFFKQCGSPDREENSNRSIQINMNLERHKQRIRDKLDSKEGQVLIKQRTHDVETCFGDIKENQNLRRVHLRGLKKVKIDFTLAAIAHNLRKMQIGILLNAEKTA